jgi:hypothetical protein
MKGKWRFALQNIIGVPRTICSGIDLQQHVVIVWHFDLGVQGMLEQYCFKVLVIFLFMYKWDVGSFIKSNKKQNGVQLAG